MEPTERTADDRLARVRELVAAAARRGFFAVVALLERLRPDAARVGGAGPPSAEAIRFRHDSALTFASGDVSAVRERGTGWEVVATFLGVTGASSPVPNHLAEDILHEEEERPLRRDFLDLFHHRFISLLTRQVARYDWAREALKDADDDWARRVRALLGFDGWAGVRPPLPAWRVLRLAPLLVTRARTSRGLTLALEDVLGPELPGATFSVEEFVGTWVALEPRDRVRLGQVNSRLGTELILGGRVWDRAGAFRVTIGPLAQREYDRLVPGGDLHAVARQVIALMVDEPLEGDLELVMAEQPAFLLTPKRARLGNNTWLGASAGQVRRVVELTATESRTAVA